MAELAAVEQELVRSWEEREQQLDSVVHQQQFYHLATQLDRVTATQEAQLKSVDYGHTVPQVEALIKKHEAFENVFAAQDKTVSVEYL